MITRLQITVLLSLTVAVWWLVLFIQGTPISRQHLAPFTIVGGFLGVISLAFEHFLWRQRLLHGWFVKRPDLRGTWRVDLKSDWVNPETKKQIPSIQCFMGITQTFSKLHLHLMTPESESWSIAERICDSVKGNGYEIVGVYTNHPHLELRGKRSEIHLGAIVLDSHGASQLRPDVLSGEYWTDRTTKGTMTLSNRTKQIYTRYEDAEAALVKMPKVSAGTSAP
jgi:hypothetical protein